MKNYLNTLKHGFIFGGGFVLAVALAIGIINITEREKKYDTVKRTFDVENLEFTKPGKSLSGQITTVRFKIINPKEKYLDSVFLDVEFFDKNRAFLFGGEYGGSWMKLSPSSDDNMNIQVPIPETINFEDVTEVRVKVYELSADWI